MTREQLAAWFTDLAGRRPREMLSNHAGLTLPAQSWITEVGALIEAAFPPSHFVSRRFNEPIAPRRNTTGSSRSPDGHAEFAKVEGVFEAARKIFAEDRLDSLTSTIRIQAEFEFIDTAAVLLGDGHRVAAAVLAGGALEVHLRRLYEQTPNLGRINGDPSINKYDAQIARARNDGVRVPYDPNDSRQILAWADHRNTAAHRPDQFAATVPQLQLMLDGIRDFIMRTR